MLSKPEHGWTTVTLDKWSANCSYTCEPVHELLEAVDYVLLTSSRAIAEFDAEDFEYRFIIGLHNVFVIADSENPDYEFYAKDIDIKDFALELVNDIEANLDAWVHWQPDESEMYYANEKNYIQTMCKLIREMATNDDFMAMDEVNI